MIYDSNTVWFCQNNSYSTSFFICNSANLWFTVIAYTYNTKNNSRINPYTSNLEVGSYNDDNNNDLLALHNITNTYLSSADDSHFRKLSARINIRLA
jgi:hypothetical protein